MFNEIDRAIQMEQARKLGNINNYFSNTPIQKGKAAQEGEVREWGGKKYKKENGEWKPVGIEKKEAPNKKSDRIKTSKEEDNNENHQAITTHERANLVFIKKNLKLDPVKAYEVFQTLSPQAQHIVPQNVLNDLVQASHEQTKENEEKEKKDKAKQIINKIK